MKNSIIKSTIILLDDTEFTLEIKPRTKGIDLFNQVCEHLNLLEKDYFGISYQDEEHVRYWLDLEKKVFKQFPSKFPPHFFFEVKFYPPDPILIQEDYTRYLLCLQVRNDVNNGRLPCSFVTYALLGSYLVQAQLGDYDELYHGPGTSYLKDFQLAPNHPEGLEDRVTELQKQHRGQTPAEAELHYLETAKKLAMYGVELFPALDSSGIEIAIGVCASGLSVYKDRLKINRFAWPKILKISYRRNSFYIKIRPGEFDQFESTVGFKLANRKVAKRLWQTAVEHHTFFRLTEADSPAKTRFFLLRFGSKFRYSGRTQYQSRRSIIARSQPHFTRSLSRQKIPAEQKIRPSVNDEKALATAGITSPSPTPIPESPKKEKPPLIEDSSMEESVTKKYKKPVGGVAVFPPIDMKRLEEQRRSPDKPRNEIPLINEGFQGIYGSEVQLYDEFFDCGPPLSTSSPKIEKQKDESNKNLSTPAITIEKNSVLSGFGAPIFKSQPSTFTREYTYISDEGKDKKPQKPIKEYGFTYTNSDHKDCTTDSHPESSINFLSRASERKATGLAFTYYPTKTADNISKSRSQSTARGVAPPKETTSFENRRLKHIYSNNGKLTDSKVDKSVPNRKQTLSQAKRFQNNDTIRIMARPNETLSGLENNLKTAHNTSISPDAAGRISRQSGLESSTSSPSVSSEGSLDEYADEDTDPLIKQAIADPTSSFAKKEVNKSSVEYRSAFNPISTNFEKSKKFFSHKGDPEFQKPQSRHRIMHASRQRIITKSDGTIEKTEEILEPSDTHAPLDSKPVVVGVVPSSSKNILPYRSPSQVKRSGGPPLISELSHVISSETYTTTTKNIPTNDGLEKKNPKKHKTSLVEEKEKTIGTKISESSKFITGHFEDVAPLLKKEGFDIDPIKIKGGIEPAPIKKEETEKFSYLTTKEHDDPSSKYEFFSAPHERPSSLKTSRLPTSGREVFHDRSEMVSSQSVSTKTKTVETVTYKMEKDGVVETRMEQKVIVKSDGDPVDHDKALAEAIQQATMMSPDMKVEKIEIKQHPNG